MKKSLIIVLIVIAVCIGVVTTSIGNTSQYVNFSEAKESPNKEFHIVGSWVKEKGLQYDPIQDPNFFSFYLKDDKGAESKVILLNNKPQDFEKAEKIVVVGKFDQGNFSASNILMKCPSKYNDEKSTMASTNNNIEK